ILDYLREIVGAAGAEAKPEVALRTFGKGGGPRHPGAHRRGRSYIRIKNNRKLGRSRSDGYPKEREERGGATHGALRAFSHPFLSMSVSSDTGFVLGAGGLNCRHVHPTVLFRAVQFGLKYRHLA